MTPIWSIHKAIDELPCTATMRKVLHVGPANTPGGMGRVIQILSASPPEGWSTETLDSHSTGNVFSKLIAWNKAKKFINKNAHKYDIIHFHSAAHFSFRRKVSLLKIAEKKGIVTVFHIHSGAFKEDNYKNLPLKVLTKTNVVTLSETWMKRYLKIMGSSTAIINPVDPTITPGHNRVPGQFLLLGRPDPVKGHMFAINLISKLNSMGKECTLFATGIKEKMAFTQSLGWVDEEEKKRLLQTSEALLVPSEYEGQPLVILEALAANCPVVASSNIPDLANCVNVAEFDNQVDWIRAIDEMNSEGLLEAVEAHRIENISARWGEFYESIIDSKASTE